MKPRILLIACCLLFSASSIYAQAAPPSQSPDVATELRKSFTEVNGWVNPGSGNGARRQV
jgi:hypothetical protein